MMPPLIDLNVYRQHIKRFLQGQPFHPVLKMIDHHLQERLKDIKRPLDSMIIFGAPWYTDLQPHNALHIAHIDQAIPPLLSEAVYIPMQLHWINDLTAFLKACYESLKDDGVIMATCLVEGSFKELAASLLHADIQQWGGASPRMTPLKTLQDLGESLQKAGFQNITMDQDQFVFSYASLQHLLWDMRSAAGSNALYQRTRRSTTRRFWRDVEAFYAQNYIQDTPWPVTLHLASMTAWKPQRHC